MGFYSWGAALHTSVINQKKHGKNYTHVSRFIMHIGKCQTPAVLSLSLEMT